MLLHNFAIDFILCKIMLGIKLISKSYLLQSGIRRIGFKFIFDELKQCKKVENIRFYYKTFTSHTCKQLFANRDYAVVSSSFKHSSVQGKLKNENGQEPKSYYEELLHDRTIQALQSVLIEIKKNEDIPYAVAYCEKFGTIKNAYSYPGEKENYFLLLEFSNETGPETLLKTCECKNLPDVVPVCSRLLQYEKMCYSNLPEVNITVESIPKSSLKEGASISEIIQDIYSTEKLTELDTRLRYFFCVLIQESVSGLFPHCEVTPFGSSVNGMGRRGCDLDVKLKLYSKQVNSNTELSFVNKSYAGKRKIYLQRIINCLAEVFRAFYPGVYIVDKVLLARVPIVKMQNKILKLDCDISINNMASVYMSNIMHFCGEIDDRVRPLMFAVKKWAKEANVTNSTPGSTISNFGLCNLVIFFLQNRPNPIVPPFNDALVIIGEEDSNDFGIKFLKSTAVWKSCASLNTESLAMLLKEFLLFLALEPFQECIISFMSGKKRPRPREDSLPLWMQYPFDEGMNITRNVSCSEFEIIQQKAKLSAKYLEDNLVLNENQVNDFCVLVGIPSVCNIGVQENNVHSLFLDVKASKKGRHGLL